MWQIRLSDTVSLNFGTLFASGFLGTMLCFHSEWTSTIMCFPPDANFLVVLSIFFSYFILLARLDILWAPVGGLSSLLADLVSGLSFFHYDLPRPHLTNSTNLKYVLQNVYVSNTVVLSFSLQLGCVTYKELFPYLLLFYVDSENGCLSPFTGF